MFILVTDAHDGEQFLLNTAYVRGIYPFPANGMPRMARSVAVFKSKNEDAIPLTESVSGIACLLRGELPPLDVVGMRNKIEAAIEERKARSAEQTSAIWPK